MCYRPHHPEKGTAQQSFGVSNGSGGRNRAYDLMDATRWFFVLWGGLQAGIYSAEYKCLRKLLWHRSTTGKEFITLSSSMNTESVTSKNTGESRKRNAEKELQAQPPGDRVRIHGAATILRPAPPLRPGKECQSAGRLPPGPPEKPSCRYNDHPLQQDELDVRFDGGGNEL